jgi:hypothetical protein
MAQLRIAESCPLPVPIVNLAVFEAYSNAKGLTNALNQTLTDEATKNIQATGKFTLVSLAEADGRFVRLL